MKISWERQASSVEHISCAYHSLKTGHVIKINELQAHDAPI